MLQHSGFKLPIFTDRGKLNMRVVGELLGSLVEFTIFCFDNRRDPAAIKCYVKMETRSIVQPYRAV